MQRFSRLAMLVTIIALTQQASAFVLTEYKPVHIHVPLNEKPMVHTAVTLLQRDLRSVLGAEMEVVMRKPQIIVATMCDENQSILDNTRLDFSWLNGRSQAFIMAVDYNDRLVIVGSDCYGTAYGVIELTRMLGVSAWEWWADVEPEPKTELRLASDFSTRQMPNVTFRGIFINDEDWGLQPWATTHYEPNDQKAIGPKTTERIFELMLRLRANLYWPPMHSCTKPFFLTEGNALLAHKYGIYIGTSHCEPMACNTNGEWRVRATGDYNFITNHDVVIDFWRQRVEETTGQNVIYTLGMRGMHDGQMQGVNSPEETKDLLAKVIDEQRQLLSECNNRDVYTVPQVFIPYKEVLDAYNAGLQVPDDVTLMWCDDNYGYIRHFPTKAEQRRSGGNGIYYHISYWGRPHDYLWLGTASPFLMYQQLYEAYYHGAFRIWMLNVGDIKPNEYQISLFMDMAWNIEDVRKLTIGRHLEEFYAETVGRDVARLLSIYMKEHFHLSFQMKPEHLAGTRVEEPNDGPIDWTQVRDLPWSEKKIRHRLGRYDLMRRNIKWIGDSIRRTHPQRADAFFELVEYPIMTTIAQNNKYLMAQLARHGKTWKAGDNVQSTWARSDSAHNQIQYLTNRYNRLQHGKWSGIMNSNPRNLQVFHPVPHIRLNTPLMPEPATIAHFYGASYNGSSFAGGDVLDPVLGLGASIRAMPIPKDFNLTYKFRHNFRPNQLCTVVLHMLPTHPIEEQQRLTISLDGCTPTVLTYNTEGRSEEWKQNVLRNYAVITVNLPVTQIHGEHSIVLAALDDGVVVDEIFVR